MLGGCVSRENVRSTLASSRIPLRRGLRCGSSRSSPNARKINAHLFITSTALPRVGVARPNGSYVARTPLVCWPRGSLSFRTQQRNRRAYRASTPRIRVCGKSCFFPLALYAVAKSYCWSCAVKRVRTRQNSPRRLSIAIVDLASG